MLEPDKLQHDHSTAFAIVEQYSSATFVSLLFPIHKEKFSMCFTDSVIFYSFFTLFLLIA
jgi:hypothetical protein